MPELVLTQNDTNAILEACTRLFGAILLVTTPKDRITDDNELLRRSEQMMARLGDCRDLAENTRRPLTLDEASKVIAAVAKAVIETLESK